jgi:hypothetical protein
LKSTLLRVNRLDCLPVLAGPLFYGRVQPSIGMDAWFIRIPAPFRWGDFKPVRCPQLLASSVNLHICLEFPLVF